MKKFIPAFILAILFLSLLPALAIDAPVNLPQVTEKARHNLQTALDQIEISLSSAEKALALTDYQSSASHGILKDLAVSIPGAIDSLIISPQGVIKVVEPEAYAKFVGKSVAGQEQFSKIMQNHKPMLSLLFAPLEGGKAVVAHYPLFTHQGKFDGTLSLLLNSEAYLGNLFSQLSQELDKKYYFTVIQKDGTILYNPLSEQIGLNLFTDTYFDKQGDFRRAVKQAVSSEKGQTTYQATKENQEVTVGLRWETVSLFNTEWRVLVMEVLKEKITAPQSRNDQPLAKNSQPAAPIQVKPVTAKPVKPAVQAQKKTASSAVKFPELPGSEKIALYGLMKLSDSYINKTQDCLKLLAKTQEVQSLDWSKMKGLLTGLEKLTITSVVIFGLPDGSYYTVDKGKVKQNLKDREYFPVLKSGKTVNNYLVVSKSTKQKSVVVGVPLMKDGKFAGLIGSSMFLESLSKRLRKDLKLPDNCVFYALTPKGEAALHSDPSQIFLYPNKLNSASLKQAVKTILSQKEGRVEYRYKNTTRALIFTTSSDTGWKYCLGVVEK